MQAQPVDWLHLVPSVLSRQARMVSSSFTLLELQKRYEIDHYEIKIPPKKLRSLRFFTAGDFAEIACVPIAMLTYLLWRWSKNTRKKYETISNINRSNTLSSRWVNIYVCYFLFLVRKLTKVYWIYRHWFSFIGAAFEFDLYVNSLMIWTQFSL